jgi:hypothetical protein
MIVRTGVFDWYSLPIFLIIVVSSIAARYWRLFVQWLSGIRGHDWATASAVIDVVSVVPQIEQTRYGERTVGYLATLTYFYRNPELQMSDYCRMFNDETEAQAWATSYKGRNIMVHVDPSDPSRSVLRKEEF